MRKTFAASGVFLGTAALIVACGGGGGGGGAGADGKGAAGPSSPAGAADEKLTSKPPVTTSSGGAVGDKSPKAACAEAKPIAFGDREDWPSSKALFASDDNKDSDSVFGRKAKDKEYTMADLKALEAQKQWRELVAHMDDIAPAKRDAAWDALLDKAAPEFMAQTVKEKDPFEGFYLASHLVDKYPKLTKNKAFMDKRLEVSKTAFRDCFAQSYRGQRCLTAAQEFVNTGDPNPDSSFVIAKVVRLGQNANVAIPFFQKGLEGRKAGAPECSDEDLKLSVLSALALPTDYDNAKVGRQVAGGVCFDKLRPAIEGVFKEPAGSYYTDNACSVLKAKNAL